MSEYRLYYAGYNQGNNVEQIGLATSHDLINWKRVSRDPLIPLGASGEADAAQTSNPCVVKAGGAYHMWYQGKALDGRISICHAVSPDGLRFTADKESVLSPSIEEQNTYRAGFHQPHVLFDAPAQRFQMWFVRQTEEGSVIGYAQSSDAVTWTIQEQPVLSPTEAWEGNHLYYPFVRRTASGYELWYTGRSEGGTWQTGRATSVDGVNWTRDAQNPILPHTLRPISSRANFTKFLRPFRKSVAKDLNGSASPCIIDIAGTEYLFAHDVGVTGRLSIGVYENRNGKWGVRTHDILQKGASSWDSYFQADPFIVVV